MFGRWKRRTFLVDTGEQVALVPIELVGVDVAVVAFAQDGLDAFEFFGEVAEFLLVSGQNALADGFDFHGAEFGDFILKLGVPGVSRGGGDTEFFCNAAKAAVFGAKSDELLVGFGAVHED